MVEERLQSFYTPVTLLCDGYEVRLRLAQIAQFKNAIVVYVNGALDVRWVLDKTEEAKRFYPARKRYLYPKSVRDKYTTRRGKRRAAELGLLAQYTDVRITWTSFTALRRHFTANNQSIELKEGVAREAVAE